MIEYIPKTFPKKKIFIIETVLWPPYVKKYGLESTAIGLSSEHWRMVIQIAHRGANGKKLFPGFFKVPDELEWDQQPQVKLYKGGVVVSLIEIRKLIPVKRTKSLDEPKPAPKVAETMKVSEYFQ
jgi:hypothetical protein